MDDFDPFLSELPFDNMDYDEDNGLPNQDMTRIKKRKSSDSSKDDKKLKQLERNRETAKRCRRRKRERTDALMDEVNRLRETNRELEIKLKICQSKLGQTSTGRGNRGIEEEKRRLAEMKRISQMIAQRCSESEIDSRVKNYTEVYSDFGEERTKVLKTHIGQLEKLILPTKISKMLLWILEQDDAFFQSREASSIWNTLISELKIDDAQKTEFLNQRNKLGQQNVGIKQIIYKLKALETDILDCMNKRREQMQEITSVFTPSQQAKFLHWVENNEACVHLLDNLWKQRTSQIGKNELKDEPS